MTVSLRPLVVSHGGQASGTIQDGTANRRLWSRVAANKTATGRRGVIGVFLSSSPRGVSVRLTTRCFCQARRAVFLSGSPRCVSFRLVARCFCQAHRAVFLSGSPCSVSVKLTAQCFCQAHRAVFLSSSPCGVSQPQLGRTSFGIPKKIQICLEIS
jgi:hypothetical protein